MFNCVFSLFLLGESYKWLKYEENHSGQWNGWGELPVSVLQLTVSLHSMAG